MRKTFLLATIYALLLTACSHNTDTTSYPSTLSETTTAEKTTAINSTNLPDMNEPTYMEPTNDESINISFVDADTYIPNGRTPEALVDVILNNGEFINTTTNNNTTLSEFMYDDNKFEIAQYCVVDLNGDNINEIIAYGKTESAVIFHYEAGNVYSFNRSFRGTKRISINGIIEGSSGAAYTSYFRIDFNKDTYTERTLYEIRDDGYFIDGVDVESDILSTYAGVICFHLIPEYDDVAKLNDIVAREEAYDKFATEYVPNGKTTDAIKNIFLNDAEFIDISEYGIYDKKARISTFERFGQALEIKKYAVVDIDDDSFNEVIVFFGDTIPLAIIFDDIGSTVRAVPILAKMVQNINTDGVFMYYTESGEAYSYKYIIDEFNNIHKEILSHHYYENGNIVCFIGETSCSASEYMAYYNDLWSDTVPFYTDLSLLKHMK